MQTQTKVRERSFYPTPHELSAIASGNLSLILRAIDPQPNLTELYELPGPDYAPHTNIWGHHKGIDWGDPQEPKWSCPYGREGDRLLIKETWTTYERLSTNEFEYLYKSDYPKFAEAAWKSPITMPRAAVRFALEIASVRAVQVQDVTEEMAIGWGIESVIANRERFGSRAAGRLLYRNYGDTRDPWRTGYESPIDSLITVWINHYSRDRPWVSNPWVWAIAVEPVAL